ncbi:MAG: WapI family immunity protein [Armatimonadota bacterium]
MSNDHFETEQYREMKIGGGDRFLIIRLPANLRQLSQEAEDNGNYIELQAKAGPFSVTYAPLLFLVDIEEIRDNLLCFQKSPTPEDSVHFQSINEEFELTVVTDRSGHLIVRVSIQPTRPFIENNALLAMLTFEIDEMDQTYLPQLLAGFNQLLI